MAHKKKSTKIAVSDGGEEEYREPASVKTEQPVAKHPIIDSMKPLFKNTILRFIREDVDIQEAIISLVAKSNTRKRSASIKPADPPPPPPPPCPYISNDTLDGRTNLNVRRCKPTESEHDNQTPVSAAKMAIMDYLKAIIVDSLQYAVFVDISEVEIEDLEYIMEYGFVEGFSHLIEKNLEKLDPRRRPIQSFRSDYSIVYIKTGPKSWKKDTENLENLVEIVYGFSQKVDIKIAEIYGDSDNQYEIRKQASGGIDRIKYIGVVCRRIADFCYVQLE